MICIIDYGMGNIGSVAKKIRRIGLDVITSSNSNDILSASKLILPGVGHFASAVDNLKGRGLWDILNEAVLVEKIPVLGICLGMQLMTNDSEEGNVKGFGWIDASVKHFAIRNPLKYKVPHVGWNTVKLIKGTALFDGVDLESGFYFVHSYFVKANVESDILGITDYENEFVSAFQKDNIYGVQFHPEKSHDAGERLLRNFINL